MNLFKSSKPKETREEPEVPPRPATPEPRPVETMPDARRVATPQPEPPRPAPTSGIPQDTVPTMGSAASAPRPPAPAPEPRPVVPPPPPVPKSIPDTDALRTIVQNAVRDSEGSTLQAVRLSGGSGAPALMIGENLNFPALYEKVGVPDPSFSAEQMLVMLGKLPSGMPLEMKRETVNVTLEMLGKKINTTEESIVGDTNKKMTTLASFAQEYERKTKERVAQGEAEIADLLAQVEAKRQAVAAANKRLGTIQEVCVVETERLNEIMEFFKTNPPALVAQVFGKDKNAKLTPKESGEVKKPGSVEVKPTSTPVPTTASATPSVTTPSTPATPSNGLPTAAPASTDEDTVAQLISSGASPLAENKQPVASGAVASKP